MPAARSIPPVLDTEAALDEHIRAERVRFVFIQSALPILFSPAGAVTLCAALWNETPRERLVPWAVGLAVIAVLRVALIRTYPRESPSALQVRRWERTFVASIVVVDLWWGMGALFLLPASSAHQALIFAFLVLMAGGHASSYAAHPPTVILGVLALVLPMIGWFAAQGDTFHRAAAFAGALYIAAIARSIQTLSYFFGRSHRLAREVQIERDRAEKLARTDFLTELNNRRAFYEIGEAMLRQARRYAHPMALVMLDVDHFKRINDRYGHAAGDAVICSVAALIREQLRDSDVGGRLGGEEFAVLLPETALADALIAAERLRAAIEAHGMEFEGHDIQFTVSLGVAAASENEALDALIARADEALYRAKHAGRNSVEPAAPALRQTV